MSFDATIARLEPFAYVLLRLGAGLMFALHGSQKLLGWPAGKAAPAFFSQVWFGGAIELVAGVLIAVGLFARPAAFVASGTMAVAYTQFHWKPWLAETSWLPLVNKGEPALLYCVVFLFIAARGAGAVALDRRRG
jgi:putative oxidoreductase